MIDLIAIRARDADYNDVFEAQASMSKDIAHRLVAWPVADRRALLAYVDEQEIYAQEVRAERDAYRVEVAELREAARKVTCWVCQGTGHDRGWPVHNPPCYACADLRRLLNSEPSP